MKLQTGAGDMMNQSAAFSRSKHQLSWKHKSKQLVFHGNIFFIISTTQVSELVNFITKYQHSEKLSSWQLTKLHMNCVIKFIYQKIRMKKNIPVVVYRLSTPSCSSGIPTLYYEVLLKNQTAYVNIYITTMHGNNNNYKVSFYGDLQREREMTMDII